MNAATALWEKFLEPGPAYRGKPFWSWNGELDEGELIRQIHVMKEMGLGGFFMHSRTGLATEYLGDEWFRLTNACADEAERLGMEAWLYDEDRWPSGTAGGMVTRSHEFRARFIRLTVVSGADFKPAEDILAAFSCDLEGLAYRDCRRLTATSRRDDYEDRTVLAFQVVESPESSFYNGNTYVDTLNRQATDYFIALTHEEYRKRCGDRLGKSIRGIFTDEPHRGAVMTGFGSGPEGQWMAPWTPALPEEFTRRFGGDLVDQLPALFLQPEGQPISPVKWQYMELLQALFLENFAQPIFDWCEDNDMMLTGHVLHEDSLTCQSAMQGSLMRFYEWMHTPGVDVLTEGNRNWWIVKQLSSVARQLGQKWMLSELYGCTGWQMSFESHKAVGDWQALFGINVRCHHLSWYTMLGEAKRDYPASILHQSAWWCDYAAVETYFARLGVVLSQGEPCCDVLVISPIESVWCQIHAGWAEGLSPKDPAIQELEASYTCLFNWLAGAHVDFDYADEEMLGRLGSVDDSDWMDVRLKVGEMRYRAVVVAGMTTIRSTTLQLLQKLVDADGMVVFVGDAPTCLDAQPSDEPVNLAADTNLDWDQTALLDAIDPYIEYPVRIVDLESGGSLEEVFCQLRQDGDCLYLAAINTNREKGIDRALVRVGCAHYVQEWSCLTGERWSVAARLDDGWAAFETSFSPAGERLFVLSPEPAELPSRPSTVTLSEHQLPEPYHCSLSEPNVCVLDLARFRIDDNAWQAENEVLKVDQAVRRQFGLPVRGGEMVQPWFQSTHAPAPEVRGKLELSFAFDVEHIPAGPVWLCMERPEMFRARINGIDIASDPDGWWIDRAFEKLPLPAGALRTGPNEITLAVPFAENVSLEALYLIGDFGVRLEKTKTVITSLAGALKFGDVTSQGLPFYGGRIVYHFVAPAGPGREQTAVISVPEFEAACVKAGQPGTPGRLIPWQPYEARLGGGLAAGDVLDVEVVLTRRNTFGPLHQAPVRSAAYGPGNFVTEGDGFSLEYQLYPAGLLAPPILRITRQER